MTAHTFLCYGSSSKISTNPPRVPYVVTFLSPTNQREGSRLWEPSNKGKGLRSLIHVISRTEACPYTDEIPNPISHQFSSTTREPLGSRVCNPPLHHTLSKFQAVTTGHLLASHSVPGSLANNGEDIVIRQTRVASFPQLLSQRQPLYTSCLDGGKIYT